MEISSADFTKLSLQEVADMVSDMKALEFGIGWIRSYIPLLKEVVRTKQNK